MKGTQLWRQLGTIAVLSGLLAHAPTFAQALPDDTTREQIKLFNTDPPPYDLSDFSEPNLTEDERELVLMKYQHIDPRRQIPTRLLGDALVYYDANFLEIPNKNYLTVIDFSRTSAARRFWVINMSDGSVFATHTAHGIGSDPVGTGFARAHSNILGSEMTSLGYFLVSEVYTGRHGKSLRLDGLSKSNNNARLRDIVIHSAKYVDGSNKIKGRSWGCPALSASAMKRVLPQIANGSLLYAGRGDGTQDYYQSLTPATWEKRIDEGRKLTIFTYDIIDKFGVELLKGTQDMTQFCPRFPTLSRREKISFWIYLNSLIAQYASGLNTTLRTIGPANTKDPVTGLQLYHEGLMQVSYQDRTKHGCDELNWAVDKKMPETDPNKSIFVPFKNVWCGVRALEKQVARSGRLGSNDPYWKFLNPQGPGSKFIDIVRATSALSFCRQ